METKIIKGASAVDDRGKVSFVNDFNFKDVKRFYLVQNHKKGFIRAWHAHKKEAKYVFVPQGSISICAIKIDNWDKPSPENKVEKFVLSADTPSVLYIPEGYANGFMTLTENAKVMFFSTSTVEHSKNDDYRYPARYWNPWEIEER